MKKRKITAICLIMVILTAIGGTATFNAETLYTNGDYTYTLMTDRNISIYAWDGEGELILPEMLDVYRIQEIRNNCFFGRDDLTTVTLNYANYLTRIGYNAFKNSSVSGELNIPPQLTTVATGAFQNCDNLEILYYNAMSRLISSQCFYDCDALREVYLTDGVATIESHAFSSCDILEIVRIPDTVTSIAPTAFANCPNLVIYCYNNSYAAQYAKENGISYVILDLPTPTEPPTEPETQPATEPVTQPVTEPETQPVTEPATEPESFYLLGDVDGDGVIDITDVTFIRRHDIDLPVPEECIMLHGDVDSDGMVSVIDATAIMRWNIDLYVPYHIGERVYIN